MKYLFHCHMICLFQTEVNERHSAEAPVAESGLAGALKRALANRAAQLQGGELCRGICVILIIIVS